MAIVYFPSCKFKVAYPETYKKLADYINKQFNMSISECCRESLQSLKEDDTAVCVCNTCSTFCEESSKAKEVISIWELLAKDDKFLFPDYKSEEITLQDCWRAYDKRPVQDAVRELMKKINIRVIELPENFQKTRFCGTSILQTPPSYYKDFGSKRFIKDAPNDMFLPYTSDEKLMKMQDHCNSIATEKVACYCTSCSGGLKLGGKRPVHLMELLFNTTN